MSVPIQGERLVVSTMLTFLFCRLQFDASRRRLLADLQQRRNSIVSLETELQLVKYNLNQVSVENSELKAKVSHLKTDAVHLRVAKRAMEAKVEADKLVVIIPSFFHSYSFIHSFIIFPYVSGYFTMVHG